MEVPEKDGGQAFSLEPIFLAWVETDSGLASLDVTRARSAAAATDKRLDRALIDLGLISGDALGHVVRTVLNVGDVGPHQLPLRPVVAEVLKADFLAKAKVLPVADDDVTLTIAMVDPLDDFVANAIALKARRRVHRLRITRPTFTEAFEGLYGKRLSEAEQSIAERPTGEARDGDIDTLRDAASDAPVVRFVQDTVHNAIQARASDIHLRVSGGRPEVLFRIDGMLVGQTAPASDTYLSVISRLKILANLDIAERRLPQDGRIRLNVGGRPIDIRISTMPHINGEGAVLRLLSRELSVSSLSALGFSPRIERELMRLFEAPDGLVLVTGPTGSGKSTTLHAALKQIIRPELNVVTIEDPVEYRVDGVAQIQVDEKTGLTFPKALRALLRQDPDVILVGEIRDPETARIAVQAALTGHLVLATLHTNSALAAVPRLIDMGVEPFLLQAVLRGVLAQRLLRKTGTGRIAVGELLRCDTEITGWLAESLDLSLERRARLTTLGFRSLRDDAEERVLNGDIARSELRGLFADAE